MCQHTVKYEIFLSKASESAITECDEFSTRLSRDGGYTAVTSFHSRIVVIYISILHPNASESVESASLGCLGFRPSVYAYQSSSPTNHFIKISTLLHMG
jgi:hypothetical protein